MFPRSLQNFFILMLLLQANGGLFSQTKKIDSLIFVLKTVKEDTNRVNALNAIAGELRNKNPDTAIYFADQALALSAKNNYAKGNAEACFWIGTALTNKAKYKDAVSEFLKGLPYSELVKDQKISARIYNGIGNVYLAQGDYHEALKNYSLSLKIRNEIADRQGAATCYNNIGNVFFNLGNYPEALKNFFSALKIREAIGNKEDIAASYNNIGVVYRNQGNYDEAMSNYQFSLKMRQSIGDKQGVATSYNNIGNICLARGNYSEALKNYLLSLEIEKEFSDEKGIADSYDNIGIVYKNQGNYSGALESHLASLKIRDSIGDKSGIAHSCLNLGRLFLLQKKWSEARQYFNRCLMFSKEIGGKEGIKFSYEGLAKADSATGDFKSSFNNYKMFTLYRDSLTNADNVKKTVQSQMQYQFDKKASADSIQNSEQLKQVVLKHNQEIQQQKIYSYGGAIGFALMLVVAGVSFRAYRNKQKANEIISAQKLLVEEKQKEILDSIQYAKRIQESLLPTEKYIDKSIERLRN